MLQFRVRVLVLASLSISSCGWCLETFVEGIQDVLMDVRSVVDKVRDWSASARDVLAAQGSAATITRLEKVLAEADLLPVRAPEVDALVSVIEHVNNWRTRTRKALESKSEWTLLADLLNEASMMPVLQQLIEHGKLRAKLVGAAELSERLRDILDPKCNRTSDGAKLSFSKVREVSNPRIMGLLALRCCYDLRTRFQLLDVEREVEELGVHIEELAFLDRLSILVKTWQNEASHALAHTPDIKQLQHLLITGENLPVAFPDCLFGLRSKLARAEAWIERVRDALPRAKTRSTNELKKVRQSALLLVSFDCLSQVEKMRSRFRWNLAQ